MQGVKLVNCQEAYKLLNAVTSQEKPINEAIEKLNREGKRVVNVSISQVGSQVPLWACILWEIDN